MKFLRVGEINQEKPALIDSKGLIRNLSAIIEDLNTGIINKETINLN